MITGASKGIGLELAREFARHGHHLVLVAPEPAELAAAREQILDESEVLVELKTVDLVDPEQLAQLEADLRQRDDVEILCNNAGAGFRGKLWETPVVDLQYMLRLNVEALLRLTRAALPGMVARGHGRILQTASIAGFEPAPTMAVYHATKAFVLSLSEAVATELEGTGVTLTALCPGPVDTEFFPKADLVESTAFQQANLMPPQEVAAAAYRALLAGERDVIPGGLNKMIVFARRFLSEGAQAAANAKMYQDVEPKDHRREPGEVAARAEQKRRG